MKEKNTSKIQLAGVMIYFAFITLPLLGCVIQQTGEFEFSISERQIALIGNSLKLGISVTLIAVAMGFFCALFINNSTFFTGWKKYYFVLLMPIPFYIYALSWMYMIKLMAIIWPDIRGYSVSGIGACIFVESLAYFPLALLFILIGMENINADELRMASIYGDDNKVVRRIVLKSILPYCTAASGLICTLSMTEFSVPSMFQYHTYALDIFSVYSRTGNALTAYVQCLPLAVFLIVPVAWLVKNIKQFENKTNMKDKYRLKTSGILKGLSVIAFLVSILQIAVPVLVFIFTAGGIKSVIAEYGLIMEELNTSFWTSFWTAFLCLFIAMIPAFFLRNHLNKITAGLILYTMAIPGTIQAMGLLKIVNMARWTSIENSIFLMAWGCALKFAPFMILWLCVARMRVNQKEFEMAEIFETKKFESLKVKLHLLIPGYIAGFALVFFMTFAEEGIPLILMAPGKEVITVKIYNYLHYGASEMVSAFSVIILSFILGIEVLLVFLWKWMKGFKMR